MVLDLTNRFRAVNVRKHIYNWKHIIRITKNVPRIEHNSRTEINSYNKIDPLLYNKIHIAKQKSLPPKHKKRANENMKKKTI